MPDFTDYYNLKSCYLAARVSDSVIPKDFIPVVGLLDTAALEVTLDGIPDIFVLGFIRVGPHGRIHVNLDSVFQVPLESKSCNTRANL